MKYISAVIGDPVSHSLSPRLHQAALREVGVSGESTALQVDRKSLKRFGELIDGFKFLSVTMPLKEIISEYCVGLTPTAKLINSVNSMKLTDVGWLGTSTDGDGFLDAVENCGFEVSHNTDVAIHGTGGSAKAIAEALLRKGCSSVTLFGRNEIAGSRIRSQLPGLSFNEQGEALFDLIVNTIPTSAGEGRGRRSIDDQYSPSCLAVDITYNPEFSSWLRDMNDRGCAIMNGKSMLVFQARRQFEWWFDCVIDPKVLFAAVSQ